MGRHKPHHPHRRREHHESHRDPAAGTPVVGEDYLRFVPQPEYGGWHMDRWLLAPGDGNPDLAQYAAYSLQEHLFVSALSHDRLEAAQGGTVTLHYYLQTDFDGDRDVAYFQAVLFIPALGWMAVERPWAEPAEEEGDDLPDTFAWHAADLPALLADRGGKAVLPGLTQGLAARDHECGHLSDYLRAELAALPARA